MSEWEKAYEAWPDKELFTDVKIIARKAFKAGFEAQHLTSTKETDRLTK